MDACSCNLVCMVRLGNMIGLYEGICCSGNCNVSLYQGIHPARVFQAISYQLQHDYINVSSQVNGAEIRFTPIVRNSSSSHNHGRSQSSTRSSRHPSSSRGSRTNPKHDENVNRRSHGGTAEPTNTTMSSRTDLPSLEPQGICLCEYMSTSQEPMITAMEEMSGSEEGSLELSPPDTHALLDGVIRALEARHKALQMELRGWKEHSLALKKTVDNLQVSLEEFKNSIADIQDEKIPDNEEMVKKLIQEELSLYDADRTGLPDYALESPSMQPGHCWAFYGTTGKVVIRLAKDIFITAVTLEHIPASIAPAGNIASAPNSFAVIVSVICREYMSDSDMNFGSRICLECRNSSRNGFVPEEHGKDDKDMEILLGTFNYNNSGPSRQTFKVNMKDTRYIGPFRQVGLWILTNYGNPKYTCVYRFRVHGNITHSVSANKDSDQEHVSTEVGT
uniref:SUN domain-containing protein n=1 Tax=Timema cristinae TaxID=61476 RepID=A0A7R9H2F4_TIMCR|nr:unnamed protein product [Timema cristinae]